MRTFYLYFISTLLILFSCNGDSPIEWVELENFPEKGWRVFSYPRESTNPGTIIGLDSNGVKYEVIQAELEPDLEIVETMDVYTSDTKNIKLGGFSNFIFSGSNVNSGISISDERGVKIKLKVFNTKKWKTNHKDLFKPLISAVKDPSFNLFKYKKYFLIREIIKADSIAFSFNKETLTNISLEVQADTLFKGVAGYNWNSLRDFQLIRSFKKPLNVFYLAQEFDPESLRSISDSVSKQIVFEEEENVQKIISVTLTFNLTSDDKDAPEEIQLTIYNNNVIVGKESFGKDTKWSNPGSYTCKVNLTSPVPLKDSDKLKIRLFKTPEGSATGNGMEGTINAIYSTNNSVDVSWFNVPERRYGDNNPYDVMFP
ncbi:MAG: hypothetical protein B6D44_06995 [Ignavibacteriales bacterium UTCHB2]|jgi:hypothetical protein|nr:MAG: hypothetical protein B6D44_06995 [Ignavibacteriales bacterium UTCHB2]